MDFLKTFTERHVKPKDRYSFDLSGQTRSKLLHILRQHDPGMGRQYDFFETLNEIQCELLKRLGQLYGHKGYRTLGHPVIDHLSVCSTEDALDVFELCFQTRSLGFHGEPERVVAEFNRVLEADAVGYELTEFKRIITDDPDMPMGVRSGGKTIRIEHPQFIRKGERTTHQEAVKPALVVLSDPRFATANAELMDAFRKVREGNYADAITSCGAAFESVLKTVCDIKKRPYDPSKETCATLADKCNSHNLVEPFYAEIFKGVGTTRNKMGDAHGKGPKPQFTATQNHAEHMIAMTCSHIAFAVRQAGI